MYVIINQQVLGYTAENVFLPLGVLSVHAYLCQWEYIIKFKYNSNIFVRPLKHNYINSTTPVFETLGAVHRHQCKLVHIQIMLYWNDAIYHIF